MLKKVRLMKIKELLIDRQQVNVSTLCQLFDVSEVTIRNDLEQLEAEGFLHRVHGGAILNETSEQHASYRDSVMGEMMEYDRDKDLIGKMAADLVEDQQWIFIGAGTTCFYVAKALMKKKNLNIITNNLYVAAMASTNPEINAVVLGGNVIPQRMALTGEDSFETLDNLCVSKAFIGVCGMTERIGYMTDHKEESILYKKIKEIAEETIVVADSKKFGKQGLLKLFSPEDIQTVVTNESLAKEFKTFLYDMKVKTFFTYDIKESNIRELEA